MANTSNSTLIAPEERFTLRKSVVEKYKYPTAFWF